MALLFIVILFLPETLRSIVGNGSIRTKSHITRFPLCLYQRNTSIRWDASSTLPQPASKKKIDFIGPFQILFSKQAAPIIIVMAIYYTVWQMSIASMSSLFAERYGLNAAQIGLTFIANGVGSMIGTFVTGKILDADYRRVKNKHVAGPTASDKELGTFTITRLDDATNEFPLEKARLRLVPFFAFAQCASILLFGWAIHHSSHVHIALPIVATFVTGWTTISTQSIIMTYLVDIFPDRSAAASASLNLARCLLAAGGTSAVMPLINQIGIGLAFTVCAIVQGVALTGMVVQWKFGGRWRREAEIQESKK
ncbi:hypothetical protein N0V90_010751 [Kalmusia sp. IMI 367209]|nr:hypothetical protein N0V90_010751 [Kalmusia sp. IMI 367209]